MHLALCHELMQAVRMSGSDATVINGAYPDAAGPALRTQGPAPHIGIGNVGNVVTGLRTAAAHQLEAPVDSVDLRLVAHHGQRWSPERPAEAEEFPNPQWVRELFSLSCDNLAVGLTGFEPAASSSRTRRATKLRHSPPFSGPRRGPLNSRGA